MLRVKPDGKIPPNRRNSPLNNADLIVKTLKAAGIDYGFGIPSDLLRACMPPAGYSTVATDCDDTTSARSPGAVESCDGVDNDCDIVVDETVCSATWARSVPRLG